MGLNLNSRFECSKQVDVKTFLISNHYAFLLKADAVRNNCGIQFSELSLNTTVSLIIKAST